MPIVINPGTEPVDKPKLKNAVKAMDYFIKDLDIKGLKVKRDEKSDYDSGWFCFIVSKGKFSLKVHMPGSNPKRTQRGKPWKSPRIYVDESSWLWGYGLGMFDDKYKEYLIEKERN